MNKTEKDARLAAALRENLRKRKVAAGSAAAKAGAHFPSEADEKKN